jgi:hypothetical protein
MQCRLKTGVALLTLLLGAVLASLVACDESPTSPEGTATLSVMLKDSPFGDAKALLVTFSEVSAHMSDASFQTLPFAGAATRTCDLKKLVGAQDVLGTGPLTPGHYTQLRLEVSGAILYLDNPSSGPACAPSIAAPAGASVPVNVPSGTVRLNRQFDVTANNTTTITLDFDGDQSVIQTGSGTYQLKPVISVVSVQ